MSFGFQSDIHDDYGSKCMLVALEMSEKLLLSKSHLKISSNQANLIAADQKSLIKWYFSIWHMLIVLFATV